MNHHNLNQRRAFSAWPKVEVSPAETRGRIRLVVLQRLGGNGDHVVIAEDDVNPHNPAEVELCIRWLSRFAPATTIRAAIRDERTRELIRRAAA